MRCLAMLLLLSMLGACETTREEAVSFRVSSLSQNGVNADLRLQSDWGTGYCAELDVQNTSAAPVTSWTAVVELNQSTLTQIWNGTADQSGSRITVRPVAWNATLAPGASAASVGFCGNATGANHRPALVSLSVGGGSSGGGSSDAGSSDSGSGGGGAASYTLTLTTSGNGSTTPAAGTHTYAAGTLVQVAAAPASGATFTGWSGAATGAANPVTVTMDGNKSLTASFSAGGGSGSVPTDRLTGVNWFGFETSNYAPHGLWARDYKSMLKQIKDLGFNALRLPWCNDMLSASPNGIQINASGVDPYTKQAGLNVDLAGLTSLQVMDKIIDECQRIGLKVILDNHSRAADGYMNETLWYTSAYSEADWIRDWKLVAERYKGNSAVVAADLKNEPHGNTGTGMKPPATWGYDEAGYGSTDWRKAAIAAGRAVLSVNPNLIVIVEGVEQGRDATYWWGGNLAGVADAPIAASDIPAKSLWYSAHEYGPEVYSQSWFSAADFPANLPAIWRSKFWFIHDQGLAPLFFGEFGIKEESAANPDSAAYKWFTSFLELMGRSSHWTFWCMNPNSGDTGGILKDDWVSVNTAKYNLLKPYLAGASGGGGPVQYALSIAVSGSGSTSPAAGSYTYASGSSAQVTATPAAGATFTGWSGAATGTANPVTVTMNGNKTLTANFTTSQVPRYALTIAVSGSGSTSPAAGPYTYASGASVQVTATPAAGATFTGWSGAATGTANPVTVTMNGNKTLTANFTTSQVPRYALTIAVNGSGSTSPAAGPYTYASGASVQVTATPAAGATFTGWSGAATGTANPVTVTMNGNKTLTANFSSGGSGLPSSCSGACNAATPVPPTLSSDGGLGNVTVYSTSASNGGACNYGATNVMYYAAINVNVQPGDAKGQWQGGRICGQCAEVTALTSQGPKSIVVRIMDKCPDAHCGIDLGGSAPAAVMLNGSGRYQGQWKFVSCSGRPEVSDGAPSLAVVSGSNPWWSRVRVRNPVAAVKAISWKSATAAGSFPYAADPENAFEVPVNEVLQSKTASFQITVSYSDGGAATAQLTPAQLAAGGSSYPLK